MQNYPVIPDLGTLKIFAATSFTPLSVYSRRIAPVFVTDHALIENGFITEGDCNELGLQVVVVTANHYLQAAQMHGMISFDECVCVAVARENEWTVVTDDSVLQRTCSQVSVRMMPTLGILSALLRPKLIPKAMAQLVARQALQGWEDAPASFQALVEELDLVAPG